MKRILIVLLLVPPAFGQWAVYDAAVHQQQIVATTQEMTKFVEVIQKQVQQLQSLQEQAATLHHYVDLFGNPASVSPESVPALIQELAHEEVGVPLQGLIQAVNPLAAMTDDGLGLFPAVGTLFTTPDGVEVPRDQELYRQVAAIQQTAANYVAVSTDVLARRIAIRSEIAKTTEALAHATTDAEVQKLGATLNGLGTALEGTEIEMAQATASALVQDVATRADATRQSNARREEQAAQFTEAMENYRKRFRLLALPTPFPIP